jgi:hypothetical protein
MSAKYDLHVVRPLSGPTGRVVEGEVNRTRATWARKGRKLYYDATVWFPGMAGSRSEYIYDGEKILSRYFRPPPHDRNKPSETISSGGPSLNIIKSGSDIIGLTYWEAPLSEVLRKAVSVRKLAYEQVGGDRCLVLELKSPDGQDRRARWWLDVKHGFVLRKSQYSEKGQVLMELLATELRRWPPNVFLATRIVQRITNFRPTIRSNGNGTPIKPTFLWTVKLRSVLLGGLSDQMFRAAPTDASAFDLRSGVRYGLLPRQASERELDDMADTARGWLTAKSCPAWVRMKGHPSASTECGPQSLYMLCRLLNIRTPINELSRLSKTGEEGTTLLGLRDAARAQKLSAEGVRLSFADLYRLRQPLIGVLPHHFYVIVGFRGRSAVIINPPDSIVLVPEAKLREAWDGRALIVNRKG